ncbi:hypothetical protein ACFX1W_027769 [Malus domestica]
MGQSSFPDFPHLSHSTSALDGAQNSKRRAQNLNRQAQKLERHLIFPNVSASVIYTLSFAKITGSLSKCRFQISKRHQLYPDVSASVTYTLSLAEITGNLSKISGEVEST